MKLNLKNDIVFKAFFCRKGNEKFLKEFLEALLKIKIRKIIIKEEVNLEKLFAEEKGGRLDLVTFLNDDTTVDIEMQVEKQGDYFERTSKYASKLIAREIGNGLNYDEIKKTILINILDFKLFQFEDYITKTQIVFNKHRDYVIMQNPKWYFIELPKFREQNPDMSKKINQWLAFLDDEDKELIKMAENKNQTLKEAREVMNYLTGDEEIKRLTELRERWAFDRAMDMKWANKTGEERGRKKERKQIQVQIAKKMLAKGKEIEEIIEMTELSEKEIERLRKEINQNT